MHVLKHRSMNLSKFSCGNSVSIEELCNKVSSLYTEIAQEKKAQIGYLREKKNFAEKTDQTRRPSNRAFQLYSWPFPCPYHEDEEWSDPRWWPQRGNFPPKPPLEQRCVASAVGNSTFGTSRSRHALQR